MKDGVHAQQSRKRDGLVARMVVGGYETLSHQQEQLWYGYSDSTQGKSNSASNSLPGIAAFLQSSESLPQHHSLQRANSMDSVVLPLPSSAVRLDAIFPRSFSLGDAGSGSSLPTCGGLKKYITPSDVPPHHQYSFESITTAAGSGRVGSGAAVPKKNHTRYKPRGSTSSSSKATQSRPVLRASRYLSEADRRSILRRIEQGEKQADLAKEYQVSRAAVSNMKKRRNRKERSGGALAGEYEELAGDSEQCDDVLTAQQEIQATSTVESDVYNHCQHYDHQFAGSSLAVGSYSSESEESRLRDSPPSSPAQMGGQQQQQTTVTRMGRAIQVDTPMMQILFTRLLNDRIDEHSLRTVKERITRLLLEHAMSIFPTRAVEIPTSHSFYIGVELAKSACAIAMISENGGDRSPLLLLQECQAIEPNVQVGCISFSSVDRTIQVQLPHTMREHNVLLLVDSMGASYSTQLLARSLQALLRAGAAQSDICVVTLCGSESTLAHLLEMFPHINILAAKLPLVHTGLSSSDDHVVERVHSRLLGLC